MAGQIPLDPASMALKLPDASSQTRQALGSCQAVATAMRSSLQGRALGLHVYLTPEAGGVGAVRAVVESELGLQSEGRQQLEQGDAGGAGADAAGADAAGASGAAAGGDAAAGASAGIDGDGGDGGGADAGGDGPEEGWCSRDDGVAGGSDGAASEGLVPGGPLVVYITVPALPRG